MACLARSKSHIVCEAPLGRAEALQLGAEGGIVSLALGWQMIGPDAKMQRITA